MYRAGQKLGTHKGCETQRYSWNKYFPSPVVYQSWHVRCEKCGAVDNLFEVEWESPKAWGYAIFALIKAAQRRFKKDGTLLDNCNPYCPEQMIDHPLATQYRTLLREVWA